MPVQQNDESDIEAEKKLIRKVADLSRDTEIILNDRGWDSRVYTFNSGRYFFKFPRSKKIKDRYKYEIAAIELVTNIGSNVCVPKIIWRHPNNDYFGYEGVQGKPLRNIINSLDDQEKLTIGNNIGKFLKSFSQLKLKGLRIVSLEDEAKQIQRWHDNYLDVIDKSFDRDEQQKLREQVFETWPLKLKQLGIDTVLGHGDFHFENVLYGDNGELGIIDFGDVAYYDRSIDFFELNEDQDIFKKALETYGSNYNNFQDKIALRQSMVQIVNLGFFAGKRNNIGLSNTIKKIKRNL